MQLAQERNALVATMDGELIKELRARYVKVATMKGGHVLFQGAMF